MVALAYCAIVTLIALAGSLILWPKLRGFQPTDVKLIGILLSVMLALLTLLKGA